MKHFKLLISIFLIFAVINCYAQSEEQKSAKKPEKTVLDKTTEIYENSTEQVTKVLGGTRDRRANSDYFLLGSYAPLDLLIPSKYGISLGLISDADRTWELEYLKGSISVPFIVEDLGEMKDERISLIKRSYFGDNSFNLSYGFTYFDFSIHLGDDLLNQINSNYPSIDLVQVEALGFNLAIGNRWTFDHNITLGVDWLSWAQPVFVTNKRSAFLDSSASGQDKEDVDNAIKIVSYFPRLSLLKLQVGILF